MVYLLGAKWAVKVVCFHMPGMGTTQTPPASGTKASVATAVLEMAALICPSYFFVVRSLDQ